MSSKKTRTIERKLRQVEAIDPGDAVRYLNAEEEADSAAEQQDFWDGDADS